MAKTSWSCSVLKDAVAEGVQRRLGEVKVEAA